MDQPALSEALAFAHRLADLAAAVTMPVFGGRQRVTHKADGTPVTAADAEAEQVMRAAVAAAYPSDGFLGEEQGWTGSPLGRAWIVDPIDGTKHFADGIPLWTTLIGLRDTDGVQAAVVDVPALDTRYHAMRGGGAWRGTERVRVSEVSSLAEACLLHSGMEEWIAGGQIGRLERAATAARRTRGLTDAWGQMLVAQGSAEALVEHEPCGEWDYTAPQLIVEEAGGRMSALNGEPPAPGRDLMVTNGVVHDEVLAALRG